MIRARLRHALTLALLPWGMVREDGDGPRDFVYYTTNVFLVLMFPILFVIGFGFGLFGVGGDDL